MVRSRWGLDPLAPLLPGVWIGPSFSQFGQSQFMVSSFIAARLAPERRLPVVLAAAVEILLADNELPPAIGLDAGVDARRVVEALDLGHTYSQA
jgi:hypothetical protein